MKKFKGKATREQWMIGMATVGIVCAINAADCAGADGQSEATDADPDYFKRVAEVIADQCGYMQIDSALQVLELARNLSKLP